MAALVKGFRTLWSEHGAEILRSVFGAPVPPERRSFHLGDEEGLRMTLLTQHSALSTQH
jgi:hypothetical protein